MKPHYWNTAKEYLTKRDKLLGKIISEYHGEFLTVRGDAFYTLARSIIGQQISVKAADSVWRKFESFLPSITSQQVINANEDGLRACGLSASKVRYLNALSQFFLENPTISEDWQQMNDAEIEKSLTSIKGIGRWTAEMFMIFYLARPDIFPITDIGLQKAIFRNYNNYERLSTDKIHELAEVWKPYRTVATWYLWRSLDPVPVAY